MPGGMRNGWLNVVPLGILVSLGRGWFAEITFPYASVKDLSGMNPARKGISIRVGTLVGIVMGFPTESPVPQYVEVISRKKLQY